MGPEMWMVTRIGQIGQRCSTRLVFVGRICWPVRYRWLMFMVLDADIVAASSSGVWRVPGQPGLLLPLTAHQLWHIAVSYLHVSGKFYYLWGILEGCSYRSSTRICGSDDRVGH
jgi:hypothetical protein